MDLTEMGLHKSIIKILNSVSITTFEQLMVAMEENSRVIECLPGMGKLRFTTLKNFMIKNRHIKVERESQPEPAHGKCSECRQPLNRLPWNTRGDILFCRNLYCLKYGNPQGWIPYPRWSMEEVIADYSVRLPEFTGIGLLDESLPVT